MLDLTPRPDPREEIRRVVVEELERFREKLTEAIVEAALNRNEVAAMIEEALKPIEANLQELAATPSTVINQSFDGRLRS